MSHNIESVIDGRVIVTSPSAYSRVDKGIVGI